MIKAPFSPPAFPGVLLHFPLPPAFLVLWKRLNTESGPNKTETSTKWNFLRRFLFFSKIIRNPSNPIFRGISCFFLSVSLIFRSDFGLSGSYIVEGFPKIFEGFPIIFDPFTHFWGSFPVFRKSLKFLVCWMVSSFFDSVSSFFWVRFRFSEKVVNSQFVDQFPLFFGSISDFQKKL